MALLLVILIMLAAVVILAVALGLRRRRSRTVGSGDIDPAARPARAGEARAATGLIGREPRSGVPKIIMFPGQGRDRRLARSGVVAGVRTRSDQPVALFSGAEPGRCRRFHSAYSPGLARSRGL